VILLSGRHSNTKHYMAVVLNTRVPWDSVRCAASYHFYSPVDLYLRQGVPPIIEMAPKGAVRQKRFMNTPLGGILKLPSRLFYQKSKKWVKFYWFVTNPFFTYFLIPIRKSERLHRKGDLSSIRLRISGSERISS